MAKKLFPGETSASTSDLATLIAKILEVFSAGGSNAEVLARLAQTERDIAQIKAQISPEKQVKREPAVPKKQARKEPVAPKKQAKSAAPADEPLVRRGPGRPKKVQPVMPESPIGITAKIPAERDVRLSVDDVAKLLGRQKGTIYQLVSGDKIPFHKEGAKVYFLADEVRKWKRNNKLRKRKKTKRNEKKSTQKRTQSGSEGQS